MQCLHAIGLIAHELLMNLRNKYLSIKILKSFNAEGFQADLHGHEWELLDNNLCVDKMWDTFLKSS
jgi:hypothetical protein